MKATVTIRTAADPVSVRLRTASSPGDGPRTWTEDDRKVEPNDELSVELDGEVEVVVSNYSAHKPEDFLNTSGSARLITEDDIAKTNHDPS